MKIFSDWSLVSWALLVGYSINWELLEVVVVEILIQKMEPELVTKKQDLPKKDFSSLYAS